MSRDLYDYLLYESEKCVKLARSYVEAKDWRRADSSLARTDIYIEAARNLLVQDERDEARI